MRGGAGVFLGFLTLLTGCVAPAPLPVAPAPLPAPEQPAAPPAPETAEVLPPPAPLSCEISRGEALINNAWSSYTPARFILPPGMPVTVTLPGPGGSLPLRAQMDPDGQKILFCPLKTAAPGEKIPCASFYALDDDLAAGIRRTFDVAGAVQGAILGCRAQ